jgi:hypothetical protein
VTELFELFQMVDIHQPNDPKCPFCPKQKNEEHYKTYGGADNDGGKLGRLINEPGKFGTSTEADARPKNEKTGKDGRLNQTFKDTDEEKLELVKGDDVVTKFQAHHAISGNQCLKGDPVEKFIKAGDKVKYDTGYSVNNPQNGIWLPSSAVGGKAWPTDPAKKFVLAKEAMDKFKRQFHLGHHNIAVDVDGLDTESDENYKEYVKRSLKKLHTVLSAWLVCPEKETDGKHIGNPQIHNALDHLSDHIIKKLKGTPHQWTFFVSRHARDYTIKTRNPNAKLDWEN